LNSQRYYEEEKKEIAVWLTTEDKADVSNLKSYS